MFINDVHRKEEIRNIAIQHLRKYGIKYRPKKPRPPTQVRFYPLFLCTWVYCLFHVGIAIWKEVLQSAITTT